MQQTNFSDRIVKLADEQLDALRKAFRLSPRETQVLALLFEGLATNHEMGDRLDTTPGAVQAAVRVLFAKTGARSRHELMTICLHRDAHRMVCEAGRATTADGDPVQATEVQHLLARIAALEAQLNELLAERKKNT